MIIYGKNINLRTVEELDAEFVYSMRTNDKKTKFLSSISGDINSQKNWIIAYKNREAENKEFYFVIESKSKEKLGLVRIYDLTDDSFCWGCWLIKQGAPITTSVESALQIYEFGFGKLMFEKCHFDVRKGNNRVIAFHKRCGAVIIGENELNYYFNLLKSDYIAKFRNKYERFLK